MFKISQKYNPFIIKQFNLKLLKSITIPNIPLLQTSQTYPNNIAVQNTNQEQFTYQQIFNQSLNIARELKNILQQQQNNKDQENVKISVLLPPSENYILALNATWMLQHCFVPLHHTFPYNEIQYRIQDSDSRILLTSQAILENHQKNNTLYKLEKENPNLQIIQIENLLKQIQQTNTQEPYEFTDQFDPNGDSLILYTSGTTGKPKGAVHTQNSLNSQVNMLINSWKWQQNDRILNILPLHHIHGVVNVVLCSQISGACNEFMSFSPDRFFDRIIDNKNLSLLMAVPTIYVQIIAYIKKLQEKEQQKFREKIQEFRLLVSGSAALPPEIFQEFYDISGHYLLERFGMTEIGMVLSNEYDNPKNRQIGSVGTPFQGVQAKIINSDTQQEVQDNELGELLIKTPGMFTKYLNLPEKTKQEFTSDGYFKTGDTALIKNGLFYIQGRTSVDIIKSAGFKISALEIENIILKNDKIKEVAIVGIEDKTYGQVVGAIIVLKQEKQQESQLQIRTEFKNWCKENMSYYKVPRKIKIIDQIPRNQMQKINKKELLQIYFSKKNSKQQQQE